MNISILSNINVDSLIKRLSKEHLVYQTQGYGAWVQELINPKSQLYSFKPQSIFLILDGQELTRDKREIDDIKLELDKYIVYLKDSLKLNRDIYYFVSTIDIQQKKILSMKERRIEKTIENYWYEELVKLNAEYKNFVIFDLKDLITEVGREKFYSAKLWYLGSMKYSMIGEKTIQKEIDRSIKAIEGQKKKCLVLDLDNTLWGGVIGEDLLQGIELDEYKEGARYKDLQKRIKEIKEKGVILAISSKNNFTDVEEVFKHHKHMVLKEEDFIAMKINWNLKAQSIKELSQELNIGLDSFVFLDDNPVERESVKYALPEVVVLDFPDDTSNLESFIIDAYKDYFLYLETTEEDLNKTIMYRQNREREIAKTTSSSFESFLKSLNTQVNIWEAKEEDADRISQLTLKTNQFNLTTKRYTKNEILNYINSEQYIVYIVSVSDKYGDNGKVSVLIAEKDGDSIYIDTFLMSCRIMGRFIEDEIIDYLEKDLVERGYSKIVSEYKTTKRNMPVEGLYERLAYEVIFKDEYGNKKYEKSLL